mmetsp:Transcript_34376/g.47968  ORF Transcript_34376/g.47968 Transcript_34376/m.47968 type:complete len:229 (+) Transcript_34376:395-1081(+)
MFRCKFHQCQCSHSCLVSCSTAPRPVRHDDAFFGRAKHAKGCGEIELRVLCLLIISDQAAFAERINVQMGLGQKLPSNLRGKLGHKRNPHSVSKEVLHPLSPVPHQRNLVSLDVEELTVDLSCELSVECLFLLVTTDGIHAEDSICAAFKRVKIVWGCGSRPGNVLRSRETQVVAYGQTPPYTKVYLPCVDQHALQRNHDSICDQRVSPVPISLHTSRREEVVQFLGI